MQPSTLADLPSAHQRDLPELHAPRIAWTPELRAALLLAEPEPALVHELTAAGKLREVTRDVRVLREASVHHREGEKRVIAVLDGETEPRWFAVTRLVGR